MSPTSFIRGIGWHFEHGDVDGAVAALESIAALSSATLEAMGARAHEMLVERFDSRTARTRVCDLIALTNTTPQG